MSQPARPDDAALPLSAARRIDAIAYRFEKAWKAVRRRGSGRASRTTWRMSQRPNGPPCWPS
jgi:hypothetical protein